MSRIVRVFLPDSYLGKGRTGAWPDAELRRVLGDFSSDFHCTIQKPFRRCHFADQANSEGLGSVNNAAREGQFQSFGETHHPRKQKSSAISRDQSYRHKSFTKTCLIAGNTNVTHASKVTASAHSWAVHSGDGRNVKALERKGNSLDTLSVVLSVRH